MAHKALAQLVAALLRYLTFCRSGHAVSCIEGGYPERDGGAEEEEEEEEEGQGWGDSRRLM